MVLPMEVAHAKYARPVLEHIRHSFGTATILTFHKRLFPELSEDTVLLLAEDKAAESSGFLWRDLAGPTHLSLLQEEDTRPLAHTVKIDAEAIASGKSRLIECFIPQRARQLYNELKACVQVQALGDLADVGIGYVTGANEFFHLDPGEAARRGIPETYLKPIVRRGRALSGLRFTADDWTRAVRLKEAGFLLHITKTSRLPKSLRDYLDFGEAQGFHKAYKCRVRTPWYSVPHVYKPDAFLTYMSGARPGLVANDADVFIPNSLHMVRFRPMAQVSGDMVAALWQTSLTCLSVEIEGHALGGGMLKLEPSEAESVLIPCPDRSASNRLTQLALELDEVVRTAGGEEARALADDIVLRKMLGLSRVDCELLASAAMNLKSRRGYRDSGHEPA